MSFLTLALDFSFHVSFCFHFARFEKRSPCVTSLCYIMSQSYAVAFKKDFYDLQQVLTRSTTYSYYIHVLVSKWYYEIQANGTLVPSATKETVACCQALRQIGLCVGKRK